jgi:hypothetical protein
MTYCTGPRISSIPVTEPLSASGKRQHSPDIADEDEFQFRRRHHGKPFCSFVLFIHHHALLYL